MTSLPATCAQAKITFSYADAMSSTQGHELADDDFEERRVRRHLRAAARAPCDAVESLNLPFVFASLSTASLAECA